VSVPGGPLVSYLILLLVSLLAKEKVTFSIETYGTKGRGAFETIPIDIKGCDDEAFASAVDVVHTNLVKASTNTPLAFIPKFMEIVDELIERRTRLVSVGIGTTTHASFKNSKTPDTPAFVHFQLAQVSDSINLLRTKPLRQIYVASNEGDYKYSAQSDHTRSRGSSVLIDETNGNEEELSDDDEEGSLVTADLGRMEASDSDDDESRIESDAKDFAAMEKTKKPTDIDLAIHAAVSKVIVDQVTNIKDQKRRYFVLTQAIKSLMVFPIWHGIMPLLIFKNCFKSGFDSEQYCRFHPDMKSSFPDTLHSILRTQEYDASAK
jgi:hypothetical protein